MNKLLKVAGVVVVLVVLVGVAGTIALHILLPPEKAKALVLKQLTTRLKRDIQLDDVSVGLLTGLTLTNLKISEAPNFSHGTFLSTDEFSLRVALLPLLFKKIEIKQVVLKHPVITVTRLADGKTFNFSDLIAAPPTTPAPVPVKTSLRPGPFDIPEAEASDLAPVANASSPSSPPPFALVVSQADIEKGIVHFIDKSPAKQSADIDPLDLKVRNLSLTSPFSIKTSLKATARGIVATVQLDGQADLGSESFKIKTCTLESGGSSLSLNGQAAKLKSAHPSADLHLDIKEFNLTTFSAFVALPAQLSLNGPLVGHVNVKGDDQSMRLDGLIDLTAMQVAYGKEFNKPAKVAMSAALQGVLTGLKNVDIDSLKAVVGSLVLTGHGKAMGVTSTQPSLSLHVDTNDFAVNDVLALAPGSTPAGLSLNGSTRVSADIEGALPSSHFAVKWDGQALAIHQEGQFNKPAGSPLEASIIGEMLRSPAGDQTITVQTLSGTAASLKFNGNALYKTAGRSSQIGLNLKTNTFAIQDLAAWIPAASAYHPAGNSNLTVQASGALSAPSVKGTLNLENVSAKYQASDISSLVGTVNFTRQDADIPKLSGKLNGSDFSISMTGHNLLVHPAITVTANVASLDLDKVLSPAGGSTAWLLVEPVYAADDSLPLNVNAHVTIGNLKHEYYQAQNLDFKCNLTDVTPDLSHVSGPANLKQGPGIISNADKLASQSKAVRIALAPLIALQKLDQNGVLQSLHIPSLKRIPFDSLHGDYSLKSGMMTVTVFELVGHDLSLSTQGTVGLAGAQPLNMKVAVKLAAGSLGGALGQFTQDSSGRPTFNFTATGSVSDPHVRLDMSDVGHKAVQQLFRGLGLGGTNNNQPTQGGNSSASNNNTPSVDDLQKALKNIFH